MTGRVERIALQVGGQREQLALAPRVAVAADVAAVRTDADALAGFRNERAVGLEQIGAGKGGAGRRVAIGVEAARCRGVRIAEAELTAERDRGRTDVLIEQRVGNAVGPVHRACRIGFHRDEGIIVLIGRTSRREIAVLVREFGVQGDVAAALGEVLAGHDRGILVTGIAILADPVLAVEAQAVEIVLQDEVDDPGDRVRSVHRGIAAGDDIDTVDQIGRKRIDVNDRAIVDDVGCDLTPAVDQRQRADGAQAAQIERGDPAQPERAGQRILRAERRAQLGQVVEHVAHLNAATFEDFLRRYRRDRDDGLLIGRADARTGDEDIALGFGRLLRRRIDRGGRIGRRRRRRRHRLGNGGNYHRANAHKRRRAEKSVKFHDVAAPLMFPERGY